LTINSVSFLENKVVDFTDTSIESICSFMFEGTNVQKVIWSDNFLKTIGSYVFSDMTQLETIEIHSRITSIEESAFEQCVSLKEIFIFDMYIYRDGNLSLHGWTISSLGSQCFRETSIQYAYIPSTVVSIHRSVFKNCEFLQVIVVDLPCSKWENPDLECTHR
jgi:hypothetical protein